METPEPAPEPVAIFKKRSAKGKSNFRKRPAIPPPAEDSDSSSYSSSEDESGRKIKRRKKNTGMITASSKPNNPSSTTDLTSTKFHTAARSATIASSNDATKHSDWYDENAPDALSSKNLLGTTRPSAATSDGTYKGLANATSFIQKNPNAPTRVVGPVKAPTNIRTITVTDFAPDVCKDYKQTGFCGFGDSCKFLHAREDYKQGWQLDKEWEKVTKGNKKVSGGTKIASAGNRGGEGNKEEDEEDDRLLEGIPFACIICREKYKDPVVTRCGHYFCEGCALKRYRKDPSCAACGAGTGGVFNVAKGLKKLLETKRERAKKRREKAIETGEEVSEDEEEEE